ncbi:hypothetical protein ACT7DH_10875 [Bacillus pacificus]
MQVIWIIGGNQLKKALCLLGEIFPPLWLSPYNLIPQPLLIFFCSKQKSFMKCAFLTSFPSVSFSHIIYYQLKRLYF